MDKKTLIASLRTEREALEAALASIPRERWELPGAAGDWSVKDVLGHLAVWSSRAVTALFMAERGQDPRKAFPAFDAKTGWTAANNAAREEQRERPLERIEADFHGAHAQLVKRLEALGDEDLLFSKTRHPSLKGALAGWVEACSAEHDREHAGDLRKFAAGGRAS
ncbi:MAG: ClbS/DfsB family four-helix bundle protein [Thermoflexales bacterium]|nr:ClbS/DfsB family four-helix bundle protein [Thermoflexales bacterium]